MKRVLLGLSGGVDSAVAAYQLKEQGYDVTCCFMRNWDSFANNDILGNPTISQDQCPQEQDYEDALKVAQALDLEMQRVDFVKEYWDDVFTSFLSEYEKGRTPNPDILCNKYIKFNAFLNYALKQGFDYVATGHYAKVRHDDDYSYMIKGDDHNKDQTYFLAQVSEEALKMTLFPIGEMEKSEVRKIAKDLNLDSVSTKKDSTGICFIGERDFASFLQNYLPSKDGDIIDVVTGEKLGRHIGVLYYTIGQRKGLGIGGVLGPWYVVGKNVLTNELYVTNENNKEWLSSNRAIITGVNWLRPDKLVGDLKVGVKFRYRQSDQEATMRFLDDTTVELIYPQGVDAVTEGQEAVFYDDAICLGGGVIEEVYQDDILLSQKILKHLEK